MVPHVMTPAEVPGYPGYSITFRGPVVFRGQELVRPDRYGFYTLEDPSQPEVAAMLTGAELHTLTFGRAIPGHLDTYTITEAGTVYDRDGQVVTPVSSPVQTRVGPGAAEPAVTLAYWSHSAEAERRETVSIAWLLLGAYGDDVAARYRNPRRPQPGPIASGRPGSR